MTTNGQVFVRTKAELNRLEALRKVMAERSYRMLCKGEPKRVSFFSGFAFCQTVHASRGVRKKKKHTHTLCATTLRTTV